MSLSIISPVNSFVQFNPPEAAELCIWGQVRFCLPVFDDEDVYFQLVVQGTEVEIDGLCTQDTSEVTVMLVRECGDEPLITFSEKPQRVRLSTTQVLYNWVHGLPSFKSVIEVAQCFKIQVYIDSAPYGYPEATLTACSNCFERIASDCFTSVVEYGNEDDAFGFKYCAGGNISGGAYGSTGDGTCDPTIITFINVPTYSMPYTQILKDQYGDFPTVQVWIYDGTGQLINMGITASFDTYPPTMLSFDFGGPASGIIVIR